MSDPDGQAVVEPGEDLFLGVARSLSGRAWRARPHPCVAECTPRARGTVERPRGWSSLALRTPDLPATLFALPMLAPNPPAQPAMTTPACK